MILFPTRFETYARRGENSWWRYAVGVLLGPILAILLGAVIATAFALTVGLPSDLAAQMIKPTRPLVFFAATGIVFGILAAGYALAIRIAHGKRPADLIGFWRWSLFAWGAGLWGAALVAMTLVDLLIAPTGFSISASTQTLQLALYALPALALQTFAEEFLFRGYLTQGLLRATGRPLAAALISGALFGALHIPNGAPQAVNAAVFGTLLSLIAMRMGGIAFTWGLHLANNLFGAVVIVSGGDLFHGLPGLVTQDTPGLMWWDTGLSAVALLGLVSMIGRLPIAAAIYSQPDDMTLGAPAGAQS